MARVRELKVREELRPVASPVKTGYTSRDVPSTAASMQLAEALAGLQPSLNRFFTKKAEEQQKADTSEGATLYDLEGNRESWADFVKRNQQHAKANPWIREGYLRARMANEGDNYRTWLQAQASGENAFVEIDGQKIGLAEANPDQTSLWMQQQKKRYVEEKMGGVVDPGLFNDIFTPLAGNAERELASRIIGYQQDVMFDKAISEHMSLMTNTLRGALEAGAFDGPEAERAYQHIGGQITGMARELIKDGVPPQQVNRAVVDALVAFADANDLEDADAVLDIVQHIETSKGAFLGKIPAIAKEIETAKDAIRQENYWKIVQQEQLQQMKEKETRRVDDISIATTYFDNLNRVPKQVRLEYVKKYGVDAYTSLLRDLSAMGKYEEDARGYNSGGGGSGGNSTRANELYYRLSVGDEVTAQDVLNAGLSTAQTKQLLKAVSTKGADELKNVKLYGKDLTEEVFRSLFRVSNPDEVLDDERRLFGYRVVEAAALEVERTRKQNPDILNDPFELRNLVNTAALEAKDKYEKHMKPFIEKARTDRKTTLETVLPTGSAMSLVTGFNDTQMKSVLEMASEYVTTKNKGGDTADSDFAKFVTGGARKLGINLTPDEALKAFTEGGKQ